MEIKVINTLKDISKSEWDSIIDKNNVQMSYGYLKTIEESSIGDYKYFYIVIYNLDEVIATLPIFLTNSFCLDTPLVGKLKEKSEIIRKYFPCFLHQRVLFCGCGIAEYNDINVKEGIDKSEVTRLILQEVNDISRKEKVKFTIYKDFLRVSNETHKQLIIDDYFEVYSLPTTCLEISWESFDEYLVCLKKKYRHNIKNKINASCKCGNIEYEVVEDFSHLTEELHRLYENTYKKAHVKFEKLDKNFIANLNNNMGSSTSVILAKLEGRIVGFMLLVNSEESCINVRMGLDYECAYDFQLYYMLLYQNIIYAISNKKKKLYLSQTTYRPKLEIGAELVALKGYVKHRNPLLNKIFKFLFSKLFKKYEILAKSDNPHEDMKTLFPQYFSGVNSNNDKKSA